jgi:hypothetical protein
MKKILVCLSFMIPSVAFCCPSLEGTWSSSLEKFESFNVKWANVEDKPWSYMSQTQGYETIIFNSNNEMLISTPAIEVKIGEKVMKMPSKSEQISFDVLGCTDKDIVLKYERYGKVRISQLHFDNADTYWEYMGVSGRDGNSHIREYYTKTK